MPGPEPSYSYSMENRNLAAQTRIIWMALTMSVVLYGIVAYVVVPTDDTVPFDGAYRDVRILAFSIAGVMFFLMSLVVPQILKARTAGRLPFLMRWTLTEMTAVCGLLAAVLGQDFRVFLPLGGLALAGMLLTYPSSERLISAPQ